MSSRAIGTIPRVGWNARFKPAPRKRLQACATEEEALIVLHDHLPPALAKLDLFIRRLRDAGHTIVQDFPAACVPIVRGAVVRDLEPFLSNV